MSHVVVTGSAGGIGRAVVETLLARGHAVTGWDADPGGDAGTVACDITDPDAVAHALKISTEAGGTVTGLVNGAGILESGELVTGDAGAWHRVLTVNVIGTFLVTRAIARHMIDEGTPGSVVTIASNAARTPRWGMGAYGASKAAVVALTRTFGLELAGSGIRCNVVAPGSTLTPMLTGMHPAGDAAGRSVDGDPGVYRLGIPLGRVATPRDIAATCGFLLSDDARHITMETITIDGGATLGAA
ncbi:2,3-dihydro-2,3-dihydroxybenzoate dehydrogenase [Myceligenerans cantabricum]